MRRFVKLALEHAWTGTKARPADLAGKAVMPQPNGWMCGPKALQHCMMFYDDDANPYEIAFHGGSTRAGTEEISMAAAAHGMGYAWHPHILLTARAAHATIDRLLKRGQPLVLCVERWQHWIAVLAHTHRGYLVFDSSRPGPVIQLRSWRWLERRLRHVPRQVGQPIYSVAGITRRVQHAGKGV